MGKPSVTKFIAKKASDKIEEHTEYKKFFRRNKEKVLDHGRKAFTTTQGQRKKGFCD